MNLALARNRKKEQRIGPSPANGYTSGYGKQNKKRFSFFSRLGRKDPQDDTKNDDYLPSHATPDDMRHSFATEQTGAGSGGYNNGYGNLGGGGGGRGQYQQATTGGGAPDKYQPYVPGTAAAPRYPNASAPYRQDYDDGVYDRVPL